MRPGAGERKLWISLWKSRGKAGGKSGPVAGAESGTLGLEHRATREPSRVRLSARCIYLATRRAYIEVFSGPATPPLFKAIEVLAKRKSPDEYKSMIRALRSGFIDPNESGDFPAVTPGTTKGAAIEALRHKGYAVGHELAYNESRGIMTDVKRTGKLANGFDAADGFNMRDVDSWSPAQKAKATRVFNQIKELTARPYYVYRGRKKENIDRVQEATSPKPYPKEVTIAFVPVARPGEKPEIKFTSTEVLDVDDKPKQIDTIEIVERGTTAKPIYWADVGVSPEMLADDPKAAVAKMHKAIGAREYSPMTGVLGLSQTAESYSPGMLLKEIIKIQNDYPGRWKNFLFGVQAYSFKRRRDLQTYRVAKEKAKVAQRKLRRTQRAQFRRDSKRKR